jgi:hypothetical protein
MPDCYSNSREGNNCIIGEIEFSRVVFNEDQNLSAFVTTISDSPKAGIVKFVLLKLDNDVWKVAHEEIFQVW